MILKPQLTPDLLSTELQCSPPSQITLNPPIAAVSSKSEALWREKKSLSWISQIYVHANSWLRMQQLTLLTGSNTNPLWVWSLKREQEVNTDLKTISVFSAVWRPANGVYSQFSLWSDLYSLCAPLEKELHSAKSSVDDYGNINSCIVLKGLRYGSVKGEKSCHFHQKPKMQTHGCFPRLKSPVP